MVSSVVLVNSILDEEDTKNYLQTDFNTIYECVIDRNTPNFFDAKVVARYKKEAERLGIKIDERYMIAARNPEFRIYRMLTREHLIGRTIPFVVLLVPVCTPKV